MTLQYLQKKYAHLKARLSRLSFQRLSRSKQDRLYRRLAACEKALYAIGGIAALSAVGTTSLQAQAYCQQEGMDNPLDGLDAGFSSSPQLVDVDGDGDLDLISGQLSGNFVYYENDGTGNYTQQSGTNNPFDGFDVGSNSTPQLVDVDGDGDLDLISGDFNGEFLYYENDGAGNYTPQTGTNNPFDGFDVGFRSTPQVVDVDSDGDLDLISGEIYGNFVYYENDGTGNYTPQTGTNNPFHGFDVGRRSTPQVVDVDGDGDLDLISGNNFGNFVYYENKLTCLPASVDGLVDCANDAFDGLDVGSRSTPQLVDVDGDGDLDLISGNRYGNFVYYENDGTGNYTQRTGTNNPFDGFDVESYSSPQLVDVDGDGDLDLTSGDFNGEFLYYENDGTGNYTQQTGTNNPFDGFDVGYRSSPQLVDVDGDGDLDLISGEDYGNFVYYENDGTGNYTQQTGTNNPFDGFDAGYRSTPQVVDVDGDGDLDLISGNNYGEFVYYENDGTGNYTQQTGMDNPFDGFDVGNNSSPQLVDVDGDGDLDLISGENFGNFVYYQNTDLAVSASTATCVSNEGEVTLTITSSDTEGPYTISNAFSGSIGMTGVLGAMETIMTGITESGAYAFEVTSADGCLEVAAVVDINQDCVLPVELLYFQAKATKSNQAQLTWATASEQDNSHFIIERSRDGKQFEVIGKIQGAGTTLEQQDYAFLDEAPFEGVNYYRLQQVDIDGPYEYSEIEAVFVSSKEGESLVLFPIPAREALNYNTAQLEGIQAIHLLDMMGRIALTERDLDGTLDISALPSGQYTLIFEGEGKRVHRLVQKL